MVFAVGEAEPCVCLQYLHRFQWTHLSERLAYEQTVLHQRLRTEVSQAKRETSFYLSNVDRSAHLERKRRRRQVRLLPAPRRCPGATLTRSCAVQVEVEEQVEERRWDFSQRQTEEEIQTRKRRRRSGAGQEQPQKAALLQRQSLSNVDLLAKIFGSPKAD